MRIPQMYHMYHFASEISAALRLRIMFSHWIIDGRDYLTCPKMYFYDNTEHKEYTNGTGFHTFPTVICSGDHILEYTIRVIKTFFSFLTS